MRETALQRQDRLDREARERIRREDEERARQAVILSDGRCCGAPPEPIATSRFAEWHRRGACFGDRTPCRRAANCAALYRRLYNRGWPTLADAHEEIYRGAFQTGRPPNYIYLPPGECCGAPDQPEPTGKYAARHYTRGTTPCPASKACESLDGKLRYQRKKAKEGRR